MGGTKSGVVSVRLDSAEQELLKKEAERRGTTVSQLLRDCALKLTTPTSSVLDVTGYSQPQTLNSGLVFEVSGGDLLPQSKSGGAYVSVAGTH